MNRRSFLRRVAGGAAGLGAVVLGAKNLGSPSTPDSKEAADEIDDTTLDAKWTPSYWVTQNTFALPTGVTNHFGRESQRSCTIQYSDGCTLHLDGFFAKIGDGDRMYNSPHDGSVWLSEDGHTWVRRESHPNHYNPPYAWEDAYAWDGGRLVPVTQHSSRINYMEQL